MNRRVFLAGMAGAISLRPMEAGTAQAPAGWVSSDVGRLRRVLVHEPGPETRKSLTVAWVDHPLRAIELIDGEAANQHRALTAELRRTGAEVLEFREVLNEAIASARAAGTMDDWLRSTFPEIASLHDAVDSAALIGARDDIVYGEPDHGGKVRPLAEPLRFLMYVRDLAVMTPKGLVLAHFGKAQREREVSLLRFMLQNAASLTGIPISFDARRERVNLQGGDLIVVDDRTLFLGVGNLSDPAAAPRLARRLGMDVVAVQMPTGRRFRGEGVHNGGNGLRLKFLHLDTFFNLTGPKSALTVPYFLESALAGNDPLTQLLLGMAESPEVDREYMARLAESLTEFGTVRRFRARTGEPAPDPAPLKLVDYLRERGYRIDFIGGPPPQQGQVKHVVEHVLPELRYQGGNAVATAPGAVIVASESELTLRALQGSPIKATPVPLDRIARWHGGAHCLTLPLERDPV